jgi:hypothetical protein
VAIKTLVSIVTDDMLCFRAVIVTSPQVREHPMSLLLLSSPAVLPRRNKSNRTYCHWINRHTELASAV